MHIHGLDEVQRKLELLGNGKAAKRAATRAARKAIAVVRKAAIANAKQIDNRDSDEKIWKNITARAGRSRDGSIIFRVGVRGGAKAYVNSKENVRKGLAGKKYKTGGDKNNPGGDTWYWRFIEFGVPAHGIAPRPFMRPALQNNISTVTNDFAGIFSAEIDKELAKL